MSSFCEETTIKSGALGAYATLVATKTRNTRCTLATLSLTPNSGHVNCGRIAELPCGLYGTLRVYKVAINVMAITNVQAHNGAMD